MHNILLLGEMEMEMEWHEEKEVLLFQQGSK